MQTFAVSAPVRTCVRPRAVGAWWGVSRGVCSAGSDSRSHTYSASGAGSGAHARFHFRSPCRGLSPSVCLPAWPACAGVGKEERKTEAGSDGGSHASSEAEHPVRQRAPRQQPRPIRVAVTGLQMPCIHRLSDAIEVSQ